MFFTTKIKNQYYNQPSNPNVLRDTIVHLSDGKHPIGGLADRIKGCMELYDWCQRHNRNFKIFFTEPFLLQEYLEPNSYQWIIDNHQISYNSLEAEPYCLLNKKNMSLNFRTIRNTDFFNLFMKLYGRHSKKQKHFFAHFGLESYNWAKRYHELFRPTQRLQDKIEFHKRAIGGKYISISFRFTTLLGDFSDCVNSELPEPQKRQLIDKCKNEILKIEAENPEIEHFLIASDSELFIKEAQELPKTYVVPGKICHIDYDQTNDDSTMKIFLDLYLIMGAEKSYLVKFGEMYESQFPYLACRVSDRDLITRTE